MADHHESQGCHRLACAALAAYVEDVRAGLLGTVPAVCGLDYQYVREALADWQGSREQLHRLCDLLGTERDCMALAISRELRHTGPLRSAGTGERREPLRKQTAA